MTRNSDQAYFEVFFFLDGKTNQNRDKSKILAVGCSVFISNFLLFFIIIILKYKFFLLIFHHSKKIYRI
jgi:hypothetical protein